MTPDAEQLYRYLVRRVGRAGSIPSQATIAADLGWSVPTIKRRVRELRTAGWLDTDRRDRCGAHGGGRLLAGNRYFPKVGLPDLEPLPGNKPAADAQVKPRDQPTNGQNPQVKPRDQQSP